MRLGKVALGGDEKVLTQRDEQIWIGSSFKSAYGSWLWRLWCCGGGGGWWVVREETEREDERGLRKQWTWWQWRCLMVVLSDISFLSSLFRFG